MKQFESRELDRAILYAMSGGQALHVHPFTQSGHRTFRKYTEAAHLFDQNTDRLVKTAKKLGVRVINIEHAGTNKQHIDLCAGPLQKAKESCNQPEEEKQDEQQQLTFDLV